MKNCEWYASVNTSQAIYITEAMYTSVPIELNTFAWRTLQVS